MISAEPRADENTAMPLAEVPGHWRNLLADYPQFNHNKLAEAMASSLPSDNKYIHLPKMPLAIVRQSYDTVNRYIHDFEALLRATLSTRDGHVLSVTMLGSDMGKLYVALAQAIQRLRT